MSGALRPARGSRLEDVLGLVRILEDSAADPVHGRTVPQDQALERPES